MAVGSPGSDGACSPSHRSRRPRGPRPPVSRPLRSPRSRTQTRFLRRRSRTAACPPSRRANGSRSLGIARTTTRARRPSCAPSSRASGPAHLLEHVSSYSFDPAVLAGNVESFVGVAQVPVGLAGPLLVHGEEAQGEFYVPLATSACSERGPSFSRALARRASSAAGSTSTSMRSRPSNLGAPGRASSRRPHRCRFERSPNVLLPTVGKAGRRQSKEGRCPTQ
jgi:hypothetical protein